MRVEVMESFWETGRKEEEEEMREDSSGRVGNEEDMVCSRVESSRDECGPVRRRWRWRRWRQSLRPFLSG